MRMNPFPLIRDEKLETQKGIKKRRKVCHRSVFGPLALETLSTSATPITTLMPIEFKPDPGSWIEIEADYNQVPNQVAPQHHLAPLDFREIGNHWGYLSLWMTRSPSQSAG